MNKNKLYKTIKQLKNNIEKDLYNKDNDNIRLYIKTWVIGSLDMIKEKAQGGYNYYPQNATYKQLYFDYEKHLFCDNASEIIKEKARQYLMTDDNIKLSLQLKNIIIK